MAQKVTVDTRCDIPGDEKKQGQPYSFEWDGSRFEIDLCKQHAKQFADAFAPLVERARPVRRDTSRAKRRTTAHRRRSAEVRDWARNNDMEVSDRGRIPAYVITKYDAAH